MLLILLTLLSLTSITIPPAKAAGSTPIVWTDRKDYDPSATAHIFGYGFTPFANITVSVVRPDLVEDIITTSADEFGYFTCQYLLDGIHGTFNVTATDGKNTASNTFNNCLYLRAKLKICTIGTHIDVKTGGLRWYKSYYVKYFDPNNVLRRTSPTYTNKWGFKDRYVILPTLPTILGTWTVKLYEDGYVKRTKTVEVNKIVWTMDSAFYNQSLTYAQGETLYYKAIGLNPTNYYRIQLQMPNGTRFYISNWTTGVDTLTGSYDLPSNAPIGKWKLHVRQAYDAYGSGEKHYVDCCFMVTEAPPPQYYYLTVRTNPEGITTIPGEGWYLEGDYVNLTAPEYVSVNDTFRYRFDYWDVDGVPQGTGVHNITIYMNTNHTATAHYVTQYFLNMTSSPAGITIPSGIGWYDAGTNASIFAPELISISPSVSRYRFDGWTTADMSEIANASATSTTVYMDKPKTVTANYLVQYHVTFDQAGLDTTATGTVVTINGSAKTFGELPYSFWTDQGTVITYSYNSIISSTVPGKRFVLENVSGPASPLTINNAVTVCGNYKTQYKLTVRTNSLGTYITNVYNGTTVLGTASDSSPYNGWFDGGTLITLDIDSPIVDGSKRFVFTYWSGDTSGTNRPVSITMDSAKDVTANYATQYLVAFTQTGLDATANGVVVVINGSSKTLAELPFNMWVNEGNTLLYSYSSIVSSTTSGKQFALVNVTGPTSPFTVTSSTTVTGNYKTQYQITFNQTGVSADYNGAIVTIDGTNYGFTELPASFWWDKDSSHSFSFASPLVANSGKRYLWVSTTGLSTSQSGTIIISSSGSVTGNYKTQIKITFNQTGIGTDFTATVITIDSIDYDVTGLPISFWWDETSTHIFNFHSPLVAVANTKRYVWVSTTGLSSLQSDTLTVTTSGSIIANYTTQYYLTVRTSGLDSYSTNVYNSTNMLGTATDTLPYTGWFNEGTLIQLDIDSPIVAGDQRFIFNYWSGDASGASRPVSITINSAKNVTANYQRQFKICFDQTGVAVDYTGTVVVIDGNSYGVTSFPIYFWWDEGSSHNFTFQSPVIVTPNAKRYVWVSTTGLSSQQSGSITVLTAGNITGNYKTQYCLVVTSDYGAPTPTTQWFDEGATITASVASPVSGPTGTRYVCTGWTGTGSVPPSGSTTSVTFTINQPSSITWNWKTQHYLTVQTNPSGLTPAPTPTSGWYDEGANVTLTAPNESYLGNDTYLFDYWDVNGFSQGTGINPITLTINQPHIATANYIKTEALSVQISPNYITITLGTSVTFTSTVTGGVSPYSYQWYLDGTPVSGATSDTWLFRPNATGTYYIHLNVTDNAGVTVKSNIAQITVIPPPPPVGGFILPTGGTNLRLLLTCYTTIILAIASTFTWIKRKTK